MTNAGYSEYQKVEPEYDYILLLKWVLKCMYVQLISTADLMRPFYLLGTRNFDQRTADLTGIYYYITPTTTNTMLLHQLQYVIKLIFASVSFHSVPFIPVLTGRVYYLFLLLFSR
jgi:hypothetical protein